MLLRVLLLLLLVVPAAAATMALAEAELHATLRAGDAIVFLGKNLTLTSTLHVAGTVALSPPTLDEERKELKGENVRLVRVGIGGDVLAEELVFKHGFSRECGGAMLVEAGARVELVRCAFIANVASSGGAVCLMGSLRATDTVFALNLAHFGGAIHARGDLLLVDVALRDNTALRDGGAIWTSHEVTGARTIFERNAARQGGALAATGGAISFAYGSEFLDNVAIADGETSRGGAVNAVNSTLNMREVLFDSNRADQGGASFLSLCEINATACELVRNRASLGAAWSLDRTNLKDRDGRLLYNIADLQGGVAYLVSTLASFSQDGTFLQFNEPDDVATSISPWLSDDDHPSLDKGDLPPLPSPQNVLLHRQQIAANDLFYRGDTTRALSARGDTLAPTYATLVPSPLSYKYT